MRPITLLTDFGLSDHFVGVMKCVMAGIAPGATLIDISHDVRPFAIAQARFLLMQSVPYAPANAVHLVVVDPGVGSARRAIVVQSAGQLFVGPDNGVFTDVLLRDDAVVREIANGELMLAERSVTFHGRDVFAPVAAHLTMGVAFEDVGPVVRDAVRLESLDAERQSDGSWCGAVIHVDRYGNLITNLPASLNDGTLRVGSAVIRGRTANYASAAGVTPVVVAGSSGMLEIAVNQESAARALGVDLGARVEYFEE